MENHTFEHSTVKPLCIIKIESSWYVCFDRARSQYIKSSCRNLWGLSFVETTILGDDWESLEHEYVLQGMGLVFVALSRIAQLIELLVVILCKYQQLNQLLLLLLLLVLILCKMSTIFTGQRLNATKFIQNSTGGRFWLKSF